MTINKNEKLDGGGPWIFEPDSDISPGGVYVIDLPNLQYRGTNGYFRRWLPMDSIQVINQDTSIPLKVDLSGYESLVVPNSIESIDETKYQWVRITNTDNSNPFPKENLTVEVSKAAYNADEQARENARKSGVSQFIENVTGIPMGGFNG